MIDNISHNPDNYPDYSLKNNLILYQGRILIPNNSALRQLLILEYHNTPVGGLAGIRRTLHRISNTFTWADIKIHVCDFVNTCHICQQVKPFNKAPQGLLQPLPIPGQVWDSATMDFITHLPSSNGKTAILVVVDCLSKQAHFSALTPQFTAIHVTEVFVRDIIRLHGIPNSLVSDRDSIFISKFWQELFRLQGTQLSMSSAYHPQTDGQTEIVNRYLEDYLRCFAGDHSRTWYKLLPWAEWHYNTTFHFSIRMSPYQAVYGRPPPTLLDYMANTSSVDMVNTLLHDRTQALHLLKENLHRA